MIPYEVDPSLHTGKPVEPVLEDGFSPPPAEPPPPSPLHAGDLQPAATGRDPLGEKSGF